MSQHPRPERLGRPPALLELVPLTPPLKGHDVAEALPNLPELGNWIRKPLDTLQQLHTLLFGAEIR